MRIYLLLLIFSVPQFIFSQGQDQLQQASANLYLKSRGEVYFRFSLPEQYTISDITKIISIQDVRSDTVIAYANNHEFNEFVSLQIPYVVMTPPSLQLTPKMTGTLKDIAAWDAYPTYSDYLSMMNNFHLLFPEICKLDTIGITPGGRYLLAVKISDQVNTKEAEPEFLFSSSIHGDEVTGYVLMLRLIDYLLSNYGADAAITSLVDTMEIWINPLANPDGTYAGGDTTLSGATRGNGNNVDMNRNFPDPQDGPHPDSLVWQSETSAMMDFMGNHTFVMSMNFHGGAAVVNYPWDTWGQLHADDDWFQLVSHEYADTVKAFGPWYYFLGYDNGITNGFSWYEVNGGRQDYTTYFRHGREITVEISNSAMPQASSLPDYWDYNYRSFINALKQCNYGIRGIVTDSVTGVPLKAKIEVLGHDTDSSEVYTDSLHGNYSRLIYAGTWNLRYSCPGYYSKTINGLQVQNYQALVQDVQLVKNSSSVTQDEILPNSLTVFPNPFTGIFEIHFNNPSDEFLNIEIRSPEMKLCGLYNNYLSKGRQQVFIDGTNFPSGVYFLFISGRNINLKSRVVKLN